MNKKEELNAVQNKGPRFGKRHIQALLLFFCVAIEMASRTCLSLSIVAMTDPSLNPNIPTYDWTNTNVILSSFLWGYIAPQVLAGQLGQSYGVKWFLFSAMIANSLSMILIPFSAATAGSIGVMICRIVQGTAQAFFFPSCQTMLGRWAPESERGRLLMMVVTGSAVGIVLCGPINGFICESYYGWPGTFYLFGGSGLVWCGLWIFLGFSTPASHPSITNDERNFIETSTRQKDEAEIPGTPWKSILTSIPYWAVVVATVGISWGGTFLANEMNTYLKNIVGYSTAKNGIWSTVPTVAGIVTNLLFGFMSDSLIAKGFVSKLNARRLFHLIGTYGPAVSMLILAYLPKSKANTAIIFLIIIGALASSQHYGVVINNIDISPRFAGIIGGFSYTASSVTSLFAPLLVQFMVTDQTNVEQWRIMFIVAACLYFLPATFFVIFASAEIQPWDLGVTNNKSTSTKAKVEEQNNRPISIVKI